MHKQMVNVWCPIHCHKTFYIITAVYGEKLYRHTMPGMYWSVEKLVKIYGEMLCQHIYFIMAVYLMEPEELSKMKPATVFQFTKA